MIFTIMDFFSILNSIANFDKLETSCLNNDSSSIIFVGKCPSAITHNAITVRRAAISVDTPKGASADDDCRVFKSCFSTVSLSLDKITLKAAIKRPSINSGPPNVTCKNKMELILADWFGEGRCLMEDKEWVSEILQFGYKDLHTYENHTFSYLDYDMMTLNIDGTGT